MKKNLLFVAALLAMPSFATAQVFEERGIEFPSTWKSANGSVFVQDSILGQKSSGDVNAIEHNLFNSDNLEKESYAWSFSWDGTKSPSAKDTFIYDDKKQLVEYRLYSYDASIDEWIGERIEKYYYSEGREDSVYVSQYDKDFEEWFEVRKKVSEYDASTGALVKFTLYKITDGVVTNDMKFEYSEFNTFNKPAKAISYIANKDNEWEKYHNITFGYDDNGNITSVEYIGGEDRKVKKVERKYNDAGYITEFIEYGASSNEWTERRKEEYIYDEKNGYLTNLNTFRYSRDTWNPGNSMVYFWSEAQTSSINQVETVDFNVFSVNGALNIVCDNSLGNIKVYDLVGKLVIDGGSTSDNDGVYTLSTRNLNQGIYVVTADVEGRRVSQKVVINE